eukprot:CAMPEP_0172385892 /NCGR_PEP_ID=MMETSP1061-20121228/3504_1 /TAXON_ID=37318 /ORGANISM="Pseudo-nitzschia pungens, Strain cf. pungens" /LENGTH=95 /DNA_ID=CAMNT_0013115079 /DNA_START=561 /DNA_END=845 /DNA_ORIENTATION=+
MVRLFLFESSLGFPSLVGSSTRSPDDPARFFGLDPFGFGFNFALALALLSTLPSSCSTACLLCLAMVSFFGDDDGDDDDSLADLVVAAAVAAVAA